MRLAEKTLELTLCTQLALSWRRWWAPPFVQGAPQPLWFGLTQAQEARAGFDAATRLGGGAIILLQFKAGRALARGSIRFYGQHHQMSALQKQVRARHRLVYYVLPEATDTQDLRHPIWLIENTWFLDVASIPNLSAPTRKSNSHHITLERATGNVTITSEPVHAHAHTWLELTENRQALLPGGRYDNFETFWKFAQLLRRGGVGLVVPKLGEF